MRNITVSWAALLAAVLPAYSQIPAVRSGTASGTKIQRYVELVAQNDILKGSAFGVLAVTGGGDTIAAWNPGMRMVPASTLKLVTAGSALHRLGPDFRFETRLGCKGTVKDGVLEGDLYIIGGGDPTIASKDSIAIPRHFLFSQWKALLDRAGIKQIKGRVIGDGRCFDGPLEKDTWSYQDVGTAYGTGGDGLCFYENAQDFQVSAGASVGSPVNVQVSFPATPWMKYSYLGRTAPAGTGDQLFLYTSDVHPYAEMRGSFAIDRRPKTEELSNKFGAYTCAYYFCNYLSSNGIKVSGGSADIRLGRIRAEPGNLEPGPYATRIDDLKILGTTYSPSLRKIVRECLLESDNFYAETLLRTLGRRLHHSASYDSSYVALNDVFLSLGVDASDVRIRDGSGLSRHNYVSPAFFVRFLSAMMDSPVFGEYAATLGQPGGRHYESRLSGASAALKSRIRYKSGSMDGVRCFSGYIEPSEAGPAGRVSAHEKTIDRTAKDRQTGIRDDTIVFSVMTNNALVPARQVDAVLDRIIALLATAN